MKTYPLPAVNLETAADFQFALVDAITRHFEGAEFLTNGDLGLVPGVGKPSFTKKVEETLADFFGLEGCVLVRGAGTGAIRSALGVSLKPNDSIFVHDAPIYPTTEVTFSTMGISPFAANFNDQNAAAEAYKTSQTSGALVQLTRQKPDDSYDFAGLIPALKAACPHKPIITDDNYAVLKVAKIGAQCGADASSFSLFKLLGPIGIGCVVGKAKITEAITKQQYSGGVQVQGIEALDALRALVYAPVALALQARVCAEVETRLNNQEIKGVKRAFIANAQSRVLIVELEKANAPEVIERAAKLGAAPFPIGSESRYEIAPLFYRVSGTFLASDKTFGQRMIRINPMRAGAKTILSILARAMQG